MHPEQPQPPHNPYPPYTPPPAPEASAYQNGPSSVPQPDRHYSPMPNYSPMSSPPLPPPQPYTAPLAPAPSQPQPQPASPPAGWYTPPQHLQDTTKPASVDTYLQQSPAPQQPLGAPGTSSIPGQKIHGQYAVDYLGGIAPSMPANTITIAGKRISKKVFFLVLGGGAALLLAAALLLFAPQPRASNTLSASNLYVSMIDTADITKTAGRNIKDSKLRAINSSLGALLTGSTKQFEEPLAKTGVDYKKLSAEAKKPPFKDEKIRAKLEDARLLGTYDRAYTSEIQLRVNTMIITMESIQRQTQSSSMRSYVEASLPEYKQTKQAIEDLQSTTDR